MGGRLFLLEEFGDDGFDFLFSVGVAVDEFDDFALLVLGDDAVAFEFGFFDFLDAVAGADEDVAKGDLFSFGLFEIIHDDLNLGAHRSSVEVVVGEDGGFGFDGFFGRGAGRGLGGDGGS